jgi:hypothetical protein
MPHPLPITAGLSVASDRAQAHVHPREDRMVDYVAGHVEVPDKGTTDGQAGVHTHSLMKKGGCRCRPATRNREDLLEPLFTIGTPFGPF